MKARCLGGCGKLVETGGKGNNPRCPECYRTHITPRNARKAARYGADYRRARKMWAEVVALDGYTCARGGEEHPAGSPFDLDHLPEGLRPSCPLHNRANREVA